MQIGPTQAFYLIVNNKSMASLTRTIAEVHREAADEDGFLYMTYASQEMFGWSFNFIHYFYSKMFYQYHETKYMTLWSLSLLLRWFLLVDFPYTFR